ncbi:phage capsid protein [Albimonas sp. CAU 1670]|uniref:phage capsid protein n=1 Tax=Albimonas sp. CAU 1670 TaxID=3032599 RepID=UPI0023DAB39C|nr:phage capsid protein [Albimonas sp. CAU 1670]MDF2235373.1 phage capsid protein [Albimonas sp. CAU 1670]
MSFDQLVEAHHKTTFAATFELALQQNGSKLRPFVAEQPCSGEGATAADLIGEINYQRGTGRRRSNIENVPGRTRRWHVFPDPIETGQYLDSVDKFRMIEDPSSKLMMAHTQAIGRGIDDTILGINPDGTLYQGGILGKIAEGKTPGAATKALPAAQTTVHDGAGLTIAKLRAARKRLGLDENDLDRVTPTMAITTNQHDDLLGIVENASSNLNMLEQPHIVNGKVTRLMGFQFVEINRLPTLAAGIRSCPVWIKDMVELGVWQDVKPDMWNDTHARNTPYCHVDAYMDCVRIQDAGVHVVECQES